MAVKIGIDSNLTFGQAGSFYSSEIIINLAAGPNYISTDSVTLLPLPTWVQFVLDSGAGVANPAIQYTPDAGTTWRTISSNTLMFCDTAGSVRLFASGATQVHAFAIKQA